MFTLTLGTQLHIGLRNSSNPALDTYVEVCGPQSIGEIAEQSEKRSFVTVDPDTWTARTRTYGGQISMSAVMITCAWLRDDAGQRAVFTAYKNQDLEYNFRFTLPDGSVRYLTGPVLLHTISFGNGPNNVITRQFSVENNDDHDLDWIL